MLQIIHYGKTLQQIEKTKHVVGDDVDDANSLLSVEHLMKRLRTEVTPRTEPCYCAGPTKSIYVVCDVRNIVGSRTSSEFVRQAMQQHFYQQHCF